MKYDDAGWHYGGDFPAGLPAERGGTHIGLFLGWAITRGLVGELHAGEFGAELAAVRQREMTGRDYLMRVCDEKLTDEDLSDEGNAFAAAYYKSADPAWRYFADYQRTLVGDLPSDYLVEDTWENHDRLAAVLDERLAQWRDRTPEA